MVLRKLNWLSPNKLSIQYFFVYLCHTYYLVLLMPKYMKHIILFLLLLFNIYSCALLAQEQTPSMKQQATTLFYQGDMQAAIPLLQQLYTANHSHYYYQYLVQAYVMTKEYTKAQKLIKQHHKDKNYKALFDMAYVAKAKGPWLV